ncbi:MAG TPA: NGG1p interacting factor NIF3 [Pseudomonadales bacterium]
MFKLCFYVPLEALETVKAAVFATGAGRIGDYQECCWVSIGNGQFRPLASASPAIGARGELTTVAEAKVEMVCEKHQLKAAVAAMMAAHPYEEPAWQCWPVMTWEDL